MSTVICEARMVSDTRTEIEREVHAMLERYQATAETYGPELSHLWSLTTKHIQGGKLLRPLLLLETFEAATASASTPHPLRSTHRRDHIDPAARHVSHHAAALRVAASIEILHFAFLLHDDVIDRDTVRRGQSNLIGELAASAATRTGSAGDDQTPLHWGQSAAILMGDLLISAAHQVFARVEASPDRRERLLDLLEHTVLETVAGELTDVGLSAGLVNPALNTVLTMTTHKTATYTFELPLRAAVILAGGSPELELVLSTVGAHLGLAFQLQDDLLSVFGDAAVHGKGAHADLREGKQTAIMCFARLTSAWPSIEPDFGSADLSIERALRIQALLRECGAENFVRQLVDEQLAIAYEVLASASSAGVVPHPVREVVLRLMSTLEGRES